MDGIALREMLNTAGNIIAEAVSYLTFHIHILQAFKRLPSFGIVTLTPLAPLPGRRLQAPALLMLPKIKDALTASLVPYL